MNTCQNCHQKEVELAAEIKIGEKTKKICEECHEGYLIEQEERKEIIEE